MRIKMGFLILWTSVFWAAIEAARDYFLSDYYASELAHMSFMSQANPEVYMITATIGIIFAIVVAVATFISQKTGESKALYMLLGVLGVLGFLFSGVYGFLLTIVGGFIGLSQMDTK
ncbi:MAG: hypothetical protein ACLFTR_02665 [Candidatus Woesearchaeota archaeon]